MLFLDDFLEMLEELPMELRDRCSELRQLDQQVQFGMDRHRKTIAEFFSRAQSLSQAERERQFGIVREEFTRLRCKAQEKITISEKMQQLVEKYVAHLEKEKNHFKMELEADNPGITGQIEKRFSDYVESMIALRKESRKRKNGASQPSLIPLKMSRTDGISSPSIRPQTEYSILDDELFPLINTLSAARSRRGSAVGDDFMHTPPRKKNPSFSQKGSIAPSMQALSPATSERSWSASFCGGSTPLDQSPAPSYLSSNSMLSGPLTPSTLAMPNFSGPESRHGRPRKLTSRVQEMFKDTLQRQRTHHHIEEPIPEDQNDSESSESSDEDEEARRTWCICKEKSYGNMVACDNDKCPYEWFHYHCVSITAPPRGKWYCPHCSEQLKAPSHGLDTNF